MELDDEQIGVYRYLEYELTEEGTLIPHKTEEKLYLAYLTLQARNYGSALSYINRVEKIDNLSSLSLDILQNIFELPNTNHDTSPAATAVQHALLKWWPSHLHYLRDLEKNMSKDKKSEFDQIYKTELKSYLNIYQRYLVAIANVAKQLELSVEQEKSLIKLLTEVQEGGVLEQRLQFLQMNEEQKHYRKLIWHQLGVDPKQVEGRFKPISIAAGSEKLEDQLHFPHMSPKEADDDYGHCWPSSRSSDCFFWKMAKICQERPSEALRFKLNLIRSLPNSAEENENNLLHFILSDNDKIDPRPDNSASLEQKRLWYKSLVEKFNETIIKSAIPLNHCQQGKWMTSEHHAQLVPLQLKGASWKRRRGEGDLGGMPFTIIDQPKQMRMKACSDFLKPLSPVAHDNEPLLALNFDLKSVSKEEEAYANAISTDYREFLNDLAAGKKQVLAQKHWKWDGDLITISGQLTRQLVLIDQALISMEQEILALANAKSQPPPEFFRETLHQYAELQDPLVLSDLVLLFLKRSRELFQQANPTLKDLKVEEYDAISLLYHRIGNYLQLATEKQSFERARNLCRKIIRRPNKLFGDYYVQLLGQELSEEAHYNANAHPEYLVFEYCSNIRMRKKQVDLLDQLLRQDDQNGRYCDSVVQLIMGGGKTSVLPQFYAILPPSLAAYLSSSPLPPNMRQ